MRRVLSLMMMVGFLVGPAQAAESEPHATPSPRPASSEAMKPTQDNLPAVSIEAAIKAAKFYAQQRWPGCRFVSLTPYYAFDGSVNAYAAMFAKHGVSVESETELDQRVGDAEAGLESLRSEAMAGNRDGTIPPDEALQRRLHAARCASVLPDDVGTVVIAARRDMYPLLERFDGVAPHLKFKSKAMKLTGSSKGRAQALKRTFYVGPMAYFFEPAEGDAAAGGMPRKVVNVFEERTFDFTKRAPDGRKGRLAPARAAAPLTPQQTWQAVLEPDQPAALSLSAPLSAASSSDMIPGVPYYHQDDFGPNCCAQTSSAQAMGYWDDNGYGFFIDNGNSTAGHFAERVYKLMDAMDYSSASGTPNVNVWSGLATTLSGYMNVVPCSTPLLNFMGLVSWTDTIKAEVHARRPFIYINLDKDDYPYWNHATTAVGYNESAGHILLLHYNYGPPDTPYELNWDNIDHANEGAFKLTPIASAMSDVVWSEDCEAALPRWYSSAAATSKSHWAASPHRARNKIPYPPGGNTAYSAYCGGTQWFPPTPYANNANRWMVHGPFNTLGKTGGVFQAFLWRDIPDPNDYVAMYVSTDGVNWHGTQYTGVAKSWEKRTLNLASVPGLGSALNKLQVWVAVAFVSDGGGPSGEGAYVDDLLIKLTPVTPVQVIEPTGAMTGGWGYMRGEQVNIQWTTVGTPGLGGVSIELRQGASLVQSINANAANTGSYPWNIPDWIPPGDGYKMHISLVSDPLKEGYSPYPFTIHAPGTFVVTSPNGYETWSPGTDKTITWSWAGNVGSTVDIWLLQDGALKQMIAAAVTNKGSFTWSIPSSQPLSTGNRVRVISTSDHNLWDDSDSDFMITYTGLTVTVPYAHQWLLQGLTYPISWNTGPGVGTNVKIDLYRGRTITPIVASTPNNGTYNWTVPASVTPADDYTIRVESTSFPATYYDFSDPFSILDHRDVGVMSPNGGEWLFTNNYYVIQWNTTGALPLPVELYLLRNDTLLSTIATDAVNDGSLGWLVPEGLPPGPDYKIRIQVGALSDESDMPFTIGIPTVQIVQAPILEPILPGDFLNIVWRTLGIPMPDMQIDLLLEGLVQAVITDSTLRSPSAQINQQPSDGQGTYRWLVPDDLPPGGGYNIRLTSRWNPEYTATFDGTFSIGSPPTLTLLSPQGGEQWLQSSRYPIAWASRGIPDTDVLIEVYKPGDGSAPPVTLAVVPIFMGQYLWQIPGSLAPGPGYKVRVSSLWNPAYTGTSASTFEILQFNAAALPHWTVY